MRKSILVLTAAAALGALSPSAVNAMPLPSFAVPSTSVEQVRYVCNEWGRCWWRPDYRGYGYGYRYRRDDEDGPRYYRRPYGYYGGYGYGDDHRSWHHRWHHDDDND